MTHSADYIRETKALLDEIDQSEVEALAETLAKVAKNSGRLFILGVGGSAGHAGHAVNDFRKLCGIEAYAPTDNVSELTARVNDEGWDTAFAEWLIGSRVSDRDAVLVFSVGGGDESNNVSVSLVNALRVAEEARATILGIVGRDGGYTRKTSDVSVLIPPLFSDRVTPHTEGLCAVIWHLLVSHPKLQKNDTKWESVDRGR